MCVARCVGIDPAPIGVDVEHDDYLAADRCVSVGAGAFAHEVAHLLIVSGVGCGARSADLNGPRCRERAGVIEPSANAFC